MRRTLVISKNKLNYFFLYVFMFISIVFPNDIWGLKKISFVIVLLLNASIILEEIKRGTVITWMGVIFPLVLLVQSVILTGDAITSFSRVMCCFFFLLLTILKRYRIDVEGIIYKIMPIIIIFTLTIFLMDFWGIVGVYSSPFRSFISKYELGFIGLDGIFKYKIYFKGSVLLTFMLAFCLKRKKIVMLILTVISLILSGSRANMLFPLISFGGYSLFVFKPQKKIGKVFKAIIITSIFIGVIIYLPQLKEMFLDLFFRGETSQASDSVRIGHVTGIIRTLMQNPAYIMIGMGMGSYVYSDSLGMMANSLEIPYLDLFRQMGMVFFVPFMIFVFYPIFKIKDKWVKCAYVSYLLIAATNPLLFNSTAFIAYTIAYYTIYMEKP